MKSLRRVLYFGLVLEGLGTLRLPELLTALTVVMAIIACLHLILTRDTNAA